jgi:hypothetical protein
MKVRKQQLGAMSFIAKGTFGEVYKVADYHLPGNQAPLAFKKFTTNMAEQAKVAEKVVSFRDSLDAGEQAKLDRYTAWPRALVTEHGSGCGLLMPLIPDVFFCTQMDPDTGKLTSRPREMGWLITTAAQRTTAQVDVPDVDRTTRLTLLTQLAYALGLLHKHGWVFGDLSFKNAAFALAPTRFMLLDCDGAAALSDKSRKQFSTPFWQPPEENVQDKQDDVTDVFKLGLAIMRCMTPGKGAATSRNASRLGNALDAEGTDLVTKSMSDNRDDRPTAKELFQYLRKLAASRITVPDLIRAELVTPVVLRGMDTRLTWHIEHAEKVTILAGNGQEIEVDLTANPNGYAFRPEVSGPVTVSARNRFGTASLIVGELTIYELPSFDVNLNHLPRPLIPALPRLNLPLLDQALADRPGIVVGGEVLELPDLGAMKLIEDLLPEGLIATASWPPLADIAAQVSADITDAIRAEATNIAAQVGEELKQLANQSTS